MLCCFLCRPRCCLSFFAYLRKGRWRHEEDVAYRSLTDGEDEAGPPYLIRPCLHLWDSTGGCVVAQKSAAALGELTRRKCGTTFVRDNF